MPRRRARDGATHGAPVARTRRRRRDLPTLRDGPSSRASLASVEDKLRIAEQLDWLGVACIEGGYPQANPKDEEFFRRAVTELQLETATLVAFGSTRRPKGKVDVDPTLRRPGRRRHVDRVHRRQVVGLPRHRRPRHHARRGRGDGGRLASSSSSRPGLRVFFDAEHFFDGYKANPEFALRVLEAAADQRRRRLWCCATPTAARCPTRWSGSSARSTPTSVPTSDRHPHPERHRLRGRQLGGRRGRRRHAAPGHGQRLRRAHRQRQPHDLHPQPRAEDGHRCLPEGRSSGSPR